MSIGYFNEGIVMLLIVIVFLNLIVNLGITLLRLHFTRDRIWLRKNISNTHTGPLSMEV